MPAVVSRSNPLPSPQPLPISLLRAAATAAMAGIPCAMAASLADLQALLAAAEPRDFLVITIDPVREAPLFRALVRDLQEAGWVCRNSAQVHRAASFAFTLERLAVDVFPALLHYPYNLDALRSLRSCGRAALRVRRSSAAAGGDLYDMAGRLSNCLERKARQAIKQLHEFTVPEEWLVGKANEVELIRASRLNFDALLAPALPPQLPHRVVANLADVHALNLAAAVPPHHLTVVAVEVLRDAPIYHAAVINKVAAGWTCPGLDQLDIARRFAGRLADLSDNIIPRLLDDAEDRDALRDLRACGQGIWKARRHALGLLAHAMGRYSNALTRAARQALSTKTAYVLTTAWIYELAGMVDDDRDAAIVF